jgi:hypothetical protein
MPYFTLTLPHSARMRTAPKCREPDLSVPGTVPTFRPEGMAMTQLTLVGGGGNKSETEVNRYDGEPESEAGRLRITCSPALVDGQRRYTAWYEDGEIAFTIHGRPAQFEDDSVVLWMYDELERLSSMRCLLRVVR